MAELAGLCAEGRAIAVCPEVEGGLPVPRPPCELRNGRAVTRKGEDMTTPFLIGAEYARAAALRYSIRLAVLKAKSPSCGSSLIYDGNFSRTLVSGEGLATKMLREAGITVLCETNMDLLRDILEHLSPTETPETHPLSALSRQAFFS